MKGHENYRLRCRLKELMKERGLKVDELQAMAGIAKDTITALRKNCFKAVSTRSIERLCAALGVGIGDLFEVLPEDLWMPIRMGKEVTVHFGSRAVTAPQPVRGEDPAIISCQFVGCWDFRAFQCISEHLMGLDRDIRVRFKEHITGAGRGIDPAVRASAQSIFEGGNHIVIGSPIANQFAEEVVCHAYGVAPYNPQMRATFPYGFQWDDQRRVRSSFGWQGPRKHVGIAALPSNEIVAPHVIVSEGEGTDGALILAHRVFQPPVQRKVGDDDDERIVICLLGQSGPGTLAAAQLATNPELAAGLFPAAREVPRMRAVACKYFRAPGAKCDDNREVTSVSLIPEVEPAATAAKRAAPCKRPTGGKPDGKDRRQATRQRGKA